MTIQTSSDRKLQGKRIALVANSCWNIFKFRMNLIKVLRAHDNEVYVIAPVDEYISYKDEFPGLKHISLKQLSRKGLNPLKELSLIMELRSIYKRIDPDLVIHYTHKPNLFGGIAAALSGIPSMAMVTGLGYAFIHKGLLNRLSRRLYKWVNKYHRAVVFENDDDKKLFIEESLLKKDKAYSVMGCGVDVQYYSPSDASDDNSNLVFCFAGRLLYDKGICEFVKAGAQLRTQFPNIELWVCGELDAGNPSMIRKDMLLDWIETKTIRYFGFVEDIRQVFSKSHCVVLPSYREGMPRVILEAMAMEKPVIVSDSAGCRQTVEDGISGIIARHGDSESLMTAMKQFAQMDTDAKKAMGRQARERAKTIFNSEKISIELFEIISQVYFCAK